MKKNSAHIYPQTILSKIDYSIKTDTFKKIEIRIMLVFWYLYFCVRERTVPWHFFQLNSKDFNDVKGIFSKLEMDAHIHDQWRLKQYYYNKKNVPDVFPVFLKPEWGQNSNGIIRVHNAAEYSDVGRYIRDTAMPYIVQYAATGREEFEVYYLRSPEKSQEYGVLSITRVKNRSAMRHPINSIYNPETAYQDVTSTFSEQEKQDLWNYLNVIGDFRMARVCIKADSKEAVLRGMFQIVEINLFLPMPLILLATNVDEKKKHCLIREIMKIVAKLVKIIPHNETGKLIFLRKMQAHYRSVH